MHGQVHYNNLNWFEEFLLRSSKNSVNKVLLVKTKSPTTFTTSGERTLAKPDRKPKLIIFTKKKNKKKKNKKNKKKKTAKKKPQQLTIYMYKTLRLFAQKKIF